MVRYKIACIYWLTEDLVAQAVQVALAEPAVSFFVFSFAGACLAAPRPTPRHVQQYRDGGSSHDQ